MNRAIPYSVDFGNTARNGLATDAGTAVPPETALAPSRFREPASNRALIEFVEILRGWDQFRPGLDPEPKEAP